MNLENKDVLVLGLGISGISIIRALNKLNANIIVNDSKDEFQLKNILKDIEDIPMEFHLGTNDFPIENIDLIIKSPGIPPSANLVKKATEMGIEIITDIELAYRISPTENIIAITGTNGKTTTTKLTGEIFKHANYNTYVVGNIGVGILDKIINAHKDDVFIIEASSFQLEHTKFFKPKVSLILNLSPDHLDWHGSYKNYIDAKLKIAKNQDNEDFTVLNYDDKYLYSIKDTFKSNIMLFSIKEKLDKGIYIEDNNIIIKDEYKKEMFLPIDEILLLGKHNLENILGSISIALAMNIDKEIIKDVLREFKGVEHRLEYVLELGGRKFYNDSKGTNPDASIKAIEALDSSIILIAGGYDKGVSFDDFIKTSKGKVKALILLGQTKNLIKETALKYNLENIYLVENMKEAINLSYKISEEGDKILLSPACASWGMYNNFEERGNDFKSHVFKLME